MSSTTKVIILEQGLKDAQGRTLAAPLTSAELKLLLGQPDPHAQLEALSSFLPGPVYLAGKATSSFDLAHELIRRDSDAFLPWSSVLVVSQSAGRGQLRRKWESGAGNLYVSLRLPDLGCVDSAVPLAVGVLWQQAVAALGGKLLLKWPNDLVQPGPNGLEKVGGILIEERNHACVAGVGLNLRQAPSNVGLRENHALPAGVLRLGTGKNSPDPAACALASLWAELAAGIFSCYFLQSSAGQDTGQGWWKPLAEQALAWKGQMVEIADQDLERNVRGLVAGLREDGSLLLHGDGGIISISGGSPRLVGG